MKIVSIVGGVAIVGVMLAVTLALQARTSARETGDPRSAVTPRQRLVDPPEPAQDVASTKGQALPPTATHQAGDAAGTEPTPMTQGARPADMEAIRQLWRRVISEPDQVNDPDRVRESLDIMLHLRVRLTEADAALLVETMDGLASRSLETYVARSMTVYASPAIRNTLRGRLDPEVSKAAKQAEIFLADRESLAYFRSKYLQGFADPVQGAREYLNVAAGLLIQVRDKDLPELCADLDLVRDAFAAAGQSTPPFMPTFSLEQLPLARRQLYQRYVPE